MPTAGPSPKIINHDDDNGCPRLCNATPRPPRARGGGSLDADCGLLGPPDGEPKSSSGGNRKTKNKSTEPIRSKNKDDNPSPPGLATEPPLRPDPDDGVLESAATLLLAFSNQSNSLPISNGDIGHSFKWPSIQMDDDDESCATISVKRPHPLPGPGDGDLEGAATLAWAYPIKAEPRTPPKYGGKTKDNGKRPRGKNGDDGDRFAPIMANKPRPRPGPGDGSLDGAATMVWAFPSEADTSTSSGNDDDHNDDDDSGAHSMAKRPLPSPGAGDGGSSAAACVEMALYHCWRTDYKTADGDLALCEVIEDQDFRGVGQFSEEVVPGGRQLMQDVRQVSLPLVTKGGLAKFTEDRHAVKHGFVTTGNDYLERQAGEQTKRHKRVRGLRLPFLL